MLKFHTKLISFLTLLVGFNLRASIKLNEQESVLQMSGTGSLILSTPFDVPGTIKTLNQSSTSLGDVIFVEASNVLRNPYILSSNSQMTFLNPTPGTPIKMTLDGQGSFIQFNYYSTSQHMILNQNMTLTMTNIILKDFDLSLINFQGSGETLAKLIFGDNVIISLGKDLALSSTALVASGNTTINGNGKTLTLSETDMLTIASATTLTLQDMRILSLNGTAIRCLDDSSKVIMQGLTLQMTDTGIIFSRGSLDIKDNVTIEVLDQTLALGGSPIFTFNSKGSLQVLSSSKLLLDENITFSYNPNISEDANSSASKRHLKLIDSSSILSLNSCKFKSGLMGFALDYGQMYVDGNTSFLISPNIGGEVELGSSLQVEISPSGILDINGTLKFTTTTNP